MKKKTGTLDELVILKKKKNYHLIEFCANYIFFSLQVFLIEKGVTEIKCYNLYSHLQNLVLSFCWEWKGIIFFFEKKPTNQEKKKKYLLQIGLNHQSLNSIICETNFKWLIKTGVFQFKKKKGETQITCPPFRKNMYVFFYYF